MFVHIVFLTLVSPLWSIRLGGTQASSASKDDALKQNVSLKISSDIPKIIHQSWKSSTLPETFQVWSQTWKDCLPGWEYKLHTDSDNRDLVKNNFPELLTTFDAYAKPISRVDVARLAYMATDGGLYVDLDIECLKDPSKELTGTDSIVLACEGCHQISNAFMMGGVSAKGFFQKLLQKLPEETKSVSFDDIAPLYQTGPIFVTKYATGMLSDDWRTTPGAVKHLKYKNDSNPLGVTILDDSLIFGAAYTDEESKKNSLSRSWLQQTFPNSLAYSHWTSTWLGTPIPKLGSQETSAPVSLILEATTVTSREQQCTCILGALTSESVPDSGCQTFLQAKLPKREPCAGRTCWQSLLYDYGDLCVQLPETGNTT